MKKPADGIRSLLRVVILSIILTLLLRTCVGCHRFSVIGPSMLPGIRDGGSIVVLWGVGKPSRGDVVTVYVEKAPGYDKPMDLIKRVIGLPGDTIKLTQDGNVYVNGKKLDEPYVAKKNRCSYTPQEIILKSDEYWILGDNRVVSLDSRQMGPIKARQIRERLCLWFQVGGAAQ
jgi:signal peptidase I